MKLVVFVCSANYYRSRFAEHLFNWLAARAGLSWRAESRGLLVGLWGDVAFMSRFTAEALQERGIPLPPERRDPIRLTLADLENADLVVAVKEAEHRPLMVEQFPAFADAVEYWHVDDLDCAQPDEALPILERHVRDLAARLAASGDDAQAA